METYTIYQLTCSETGRMYFGSTKNSLQTRFRFHNNEFNSTNSRFLINPTCDILEILENVEKKQALEVERHYILNYPCINKKIPLQTKKEYENRTPESKDKIRGSRNCVCGRVYTVDHKNRHLNSKIHKKGMDKIFYLNKKNILL